MPPGQSSPGDEHSGVVVGDAVLWDGIPVAIPVHNGFLPLAEAVQGFPGVVVDLQGGLQWKQQESVFPGKLWWEGTDTTPDTPNSSWRPWESKKSETSELKLLKRP